MCNKADNSCQQEKLGCKGCFYNKNDDIEFIKNFIAELRMISPYSLYPLYVKLEKSLTNIIEQIEELKAITKTYNAYNTKKDDDKIILADKRYFDCGVFSDNLIPKSKIIEKIKEYEEFRKDYPVEFRENKMRGIIVVLKELLESEE